MAKVQRCCLFKLLGAKQRLHRAARCLLSYKRTPTLKAAAAGPAASAVEGCYGGTSQVVKKPHIRCQICICAADARQHRSSVTSASYSRVKHSPQAVRLLGPLEIRFRSFIRSARPVLLTVFWPNTRCRASRIVRGEHVAMKRQCHHRTTHIPSVQTAGCCVLESRRGSRPQTASDGCQPAWSAGAEQPKIDFREKTDPQPEGMH